MLKFSGFADLTSCLGKKARSLVETEKPLRARQKKSMQDAHLFARKRGSLCTVCIEGSEKHLDAQTRTDGSTRQARRAPLA